MRGLFSSWMWRGGGDPDREAVAGAGMGWAGWPAGRKTLGLNSGAEDSAQAASETVRAHPPGRISCGFGAQVALYHVVQGVASPRARCLGAGSSKPSLWAGVVSSLSSWVSEGTSSLTEVRLVYDELVSSLCLSFLRLWKRKQAHSSGTCLLGAYQLPLFQSRLWVHGCGSTTSSVLRSSPLGPFGVDVLVPSLEPL